MSSVPLDLFHGFHVDWMMTSHRFGGLGAGLLNRPTNQLGDLEGTQGAWDWRWQDWSVDSAWKRFDPTLGTAGDGVGAWPGRFEAAREAAEKRATRVRVPAAQRVFAVGGPKSVSGGSDARSFWRERLNTAPARVPMRSHDPLRFAYATVGRMPADDAGLRVNVTRYRLPADSGLRIVRLPPVLLGRTGGVRQVKTPFHWKKKGESKPPSLEHEIRVPKAALRGGQFDPSKPAHILVRGFACEPVGWVEHHVVPPPDMVYRQWRRMPSHLRRLALRVQGSEWRGEDLHVQMLAGFQGGGAHWGDPFQQWDGATGYGMIVLLDVVQGDGWTVRPLGAAGGRELGFRFHGSGSRPDQRAELPLELKRPGMLGLRGFDVAVKSPAEGPAKAFAKSPGRLIRGLGVEVAHGFRPAVHLRYSNDGWMDFGYSGGMAADVTVLEPPDGMPLGIEPLRPHEPGVPPGAAGDNVQLLPV